MYQVEWLEEALDEPAAIWMQADSTQRRDITEATNTIDQVLSSNPIEGSESRGDEDRVLFVFPLGVLFEVDLPTRIVLVEHVWRYRRRGE